MALQVAPLVFLASSLALTAPGIDAERVQARAAATGAVVYQEPEPPEDPTIDKAGRQMMTLLSFTTFGALTGKALFRR